MFAAFGVRAGVRDVDGGRATDPATLFEAKFNYASWFGVGSKLVRAEIWPVI